MPTNDKTDRASGSTPGCPAENGSRQQIGDGDCCERALTRGSANVWRITV